MAQAVGLVLTTPPPPGLQKQPKIQHLHGRNISNLCFITRKIVSQMSSGNFDCLCSRTSKFPKSLFFLSPKRCNFASSLSLFTFGADYPAESALSLGLEHSLSAIPRTPSPFRAPSPSTTVAHVGPTTLLRLTTSINPALFSNELEYLYTGKESRERAPGADDDPESLRIDKLRKDLVFMWRSRLYSDVRIALTGNFGGNHESTTAIFSSHRFILVSRSSYFHTALIAWPSPKNVPNEPPTLILPSPPFTPASLHFTLGFIYTGTLIFSHRSYDLSTALLS
ncbi:hypothetical protein BDZ97DRAFT_1928179 [Flammula alnicola]|nr:hypothetical protein BDZ97DRAFT_1928179 [Flammula alnicola]